MRITLVLFFKLYWTSFDFLVVYYIQHLYLINTNYWSFTTCWSSHERTSHPRTCHDATYPRCWRTPGLPAEWLQMYKWLLGKPSNYPISGWFLTTYQQYFWFLWYLNWWSKGSLPGSCPETRSVDGTTFEDPLLYSLWHDQNNVGNRGYYHIFNYNRAIKPTMRSGASHLGTNRSPRLLGCLVETSTVRCWGWTEGSGESGATISRHRFLWHVGNIRKTCLYV